MVFPELPHASMTALIGQEATDTLRNRTFHLNTRNHFFFFYCEGGQTREQGCQEQLWSLQPRRYSKPNWMWPLTTCSNLPMISRGPFCALSYSFLCFGTQRTKAHPFCGTRLLSFRELTMLRSFLIFQQGLMSHRNPMQCQGKPYKFLVESWMSK